MTGGAGLEAGVENNEGKDISVPFRFPPQVITFPFECMCAT